MLSVVHIYFCVPECSHCPHSFQANKHCDKTAGYISSMVHLHAVNFKTFCKFQLEKFYSVTGNGERITLSDLVY